MAHNDTSVCMIENNNNNLILGSQPIQTPNWCMIPPCLCDKKPSAHSDLNVNVYRGVHTLHPSIFEPMTY
jgi:hypothetical protein